MPLSERPPLRSGLLFQSAFIALTIARRLASQEASNMSVTHLLDIDLKTQLQAYLEKVVQPITLVATLDDGDKSRELEALLQEIAAMSALSGGAP